MVDKRNFTVRALGNDEDQIAAPVVDLDQFKEKGYPLSDLRDAVNALNADKPFLTENDLFVNTAGAEIPIKSESGTEVSYALRKDDIVCFRRFKEAPKTVPPASTIETYTVARGSGKLAAYARELNFDKTAKLAELRSELGDFMRPDFYFIGRDGGSIAIGNEKERAVADIAKDRKISVGPPPIEETAPKPATSPSAAQPPSVTGAEVKAAWNLGSAAEVNISNIPGPTSASGTLKESSQQYYEQQTLEVKKALFEKLHLDRGFRVNANPDDVIEQSSESPAWYAPAGEGPSASSPRSSTLHRYVAAATQIFSEMRKRGTEQLAGKGSWGDSAGLAGIQVNSSYVRDLEEYKKGTLKDIYVLEEKLYSKVILTLNREDIKAKEIFLTDVEKVVRSNISRVRQYEELHKTIFSRYGHFLPTQMVLGGKWIKEFHETSSDISEQSQFISKFQVSGAGQGTGEAGTFGAGLAYSRDDSQLESHRIITYTKNQTAMKTGGVDAAEVETVAWAESLSAMNNWAVIETRRMIPVISLLSGSDRADDLRRSCISLMREFATNRISADSTALDMSWYVQYLHAKEAEDLNLID